MHRVEGKNSGDWVESALSTAETSPSASVPAFTPLGEDVAELLVIRVFVRVVDADVSVAIAA